MSNSVLDLRECALAKSDLRGKTLSGALMSDADFSGSDMSEAVLTKVRLVLFACVETRRRGVLVCVALFCHRHRRRRRRLFCFPAAHPARSPLALSLRNAKPSKP